MLYRNWHLRCDTCQGKLNYPGWDYEIPAECPCGGFYLDEDGLLNTIEKPVEKPDVKISTNDRNVILRDLQEDDRWPEHLGG